MTISFSLPLLVFSLMAIIIGTSTVTYYILRQKNHKKERMKNEKDPLIIIYREKETVLRVWYGVIAGVDTAMLLSGILCNAGAIFLSGSQNKNDNFIVALMIISLVSYSIRDALNLTNLRKPYIRATRHLELFIDKYEFANDGSLTSKDLHKAYKESQDIIENYFE